MFWYISGLEILLLAGCNWASAEYKLFQRSCVGHNILACGTHYRIYMVLPWLVFKHPETAFRLIAIYESFAKVINFSG
jgi:hypothetical protein